MLTLSGSTGGGDAKTIISLNTSFGDIMRKNRFSKKELFFLHPPPPPRKYFFLKMLVIAYNIKKT